MNRHRILLVVVAVAGWTLAASKTAIAQETPEGARYEWRGGATSATPPIKLEAPSVDLSTNGLPHIMITGYWPPTNEMLRQFSQNPDQNHGGWVGENWEERGYNIYAFFPEFPGGTTANPKGNGDFEVDYQDTSNDWWPLVEQIHPIAIVTFSRDNTLNGWLLEGGNRTYSSIIFPYWDNDFLVPRKPTPELPSYNEPDNFERFSTQPIMAIIAAVTASGANVVPHTSVIDNGRFLSNYIGYHGNWYHDLHADRADPYWIISAGHVHVGQGTALPAATLAAEVTLRVVTENLDARRALIEDLNGDGSVDLDDFDRLQQCFSGASDSTPPVGCTAAEFALADLDDDGDVDLHDLHDFQLGFGSD